MDTPLRSITRPRPARYAPLSGPITAASAHAEPPAERVMAPKPVGTLSTQIEYRGRTLAIAAEGMTLDVFYEAVNADASEALFTIVCRAPYRDSIIGIKFTNMTIDQFCDMLDKRLGRAE